MHIDNNTEQQCLFWVQSLDALNDWEYAYLTKDGNCYYFVKKINESYVLKKYETLSDEDISDRMWQDFDSHEAWVDAVRNWDTDSSYDDWSSDIDIWNELDCDDYYSCPSDVVEILYNLGYRNDDTYAHCDWEYLDEYNTMTIDRDFMSIAWDNICNRVELDNTNKELWEDIEKKYWFHTIEFLPAEPIR